MYLSISKRCKRLLYVRFCQLPAAAVLLLVQFSIEEDALDNLGYRTLGAVNDKASWQHLVSTACIE